MALAVEEIVSMLAKQGGDPARCEDVRTALTEACMNAREHAGRTEYEVRVSVEEGAISIEVEDHGPPFAIPDKRPDMKARIEGRERPRGWGLFMIGQLSYASSVTRTENGNILRMQFNFLTDKGGIHRG